MGEIGHFFYFEKGQYSYLEDIAGVDVLLEKAQEILSPFASWIGSAIINAIHMIGPQTVFIGGKMAILGDSFIQPVRQFVSCYLFENQEVDIRYSGISSDA